MALKMIDLKQNAALRLMSREKLKGNWGIPILVCFLMFVITSAASSVFLVGLILGGPIALGLAIYFLKLVRGENPSIEHAFKGFNNFANALAAYLLIVIFTLLWSLLLIIPGIIKALSYSQTFYILADNPEMPVSDAIKLSQKMTDGAKGKLFLLGLSFIGWTLLSILTCGIGFLFLAPYISTTLAYFYEDLKMNYQESSVQA